MTILYHNIWIQLFIWPSSSVNIGPLRALKFQSDVYNISMNIKVIGNFFHQSSEGYTY